MPDEVSIRILVHRQNIRRYKFLLATPLTEIEQACVTRRLAEENAELRRLIAHRREARVDAAGSPGTARAEGEERSTVGAP